MARAGRLGPTIVALGVVSLLTDLGTEMVTPLLPLFLTGPLGAGTVFVGLVEGVAEATASLLKVASGWLADRLPRRKPLVVMGYTLSSLTRPAMALALAPWHVLAVRFVDRVGKGLRTSPRDALLVDTAAEGDRGRALGFHRSMDHLGAVLGPLCAVALLSAFGGDYRLVFWAATVPAALSVLVLLFAVREATGPREDLERLRRPGSPSKVTAVGATRMDRRLRRFLAIATLFTLGNSSDAFLLLRLRDAGFSVAAIPLLWALLHVVKAGSSWPAGILSDRLGRRRVIAVGWAIYAAVYAGFAAGPGGAAAGALFVVYGLYHGLTEAAEKALVADLAPAESRATALGLYQALVGLGQLPASLLLGWLWQWAGPLAAFGLGAILALAATAALILLV